MRGFPITRTRARALRRLAAAAAACAVVGGAVAGCGGSSAAGSYQVRAIFTSAAFLNPGLDVRIAGVKVGTIESVDLTPDNQAAVTLAITDAGFKDFRKDSTCMVRPAALIGERYVECTLTATRPDGATEPAPLPTIANGPYKGEHLLPVSQTAIAIDSDEVLDVNTASVREKLGVIVRELGTGLAGRGEELQTALRKSNVALENTNQVLKQLDSQKTMLQQLTDSTDQTLQSLASERSSLSGAVVNGAAVTGTLARREADLRASITQLNNLLGEVKPTADRANDLATQLDPIADDLNRSSADLATVLNLLPTVASRGTTAVNSLGPTLSKGRQVLTSATNNALFDRVVKTASAVKASASVLGLTLGNFRSAGGLDYILNTIYGVAYSLNGRDASGTYLRGAAINLLACVLPSQVTNTATACGVPLSAAQSIDYSTDAASGSKASTSSTASAARAATGASSTKTAGTTPKSTSSTSSSTKTSSSSSTTPKSSSTSSTAGTTSSDRTAAALLLGGGQ